MLRALARTPVSRSRLYSLSTTHRLCLSATQYKDLEHPNLSSDCPVKRTDIFEDVSSEYSAISKTSTDTDGCGTKPSEILAQLVIDGDFETANKFRASLQHSDIHISQDDIYEQAVRHILSLPDRAEHIQEFISWMLLIPDAAAASDSSRLSSLLQHILHLSHIDMQFVKAFALVCAAKGYVDFVREQIIPVIVRHSDRLSFDAFFRSLEMNASEYTRSITLTNPAKPVFSTASDNLFEEVDDEYVVSKHAAVKHVPQTTVDSLHKLLKSGDITEAARVRDDLIDIGVDIPPSIIYARAALLSIQVAATSNSIQVFDSWLSLIPNAAQSADAAAYMLKIYRHLALHPNLRLLSHFALITATKGFIHDVAAKAIPIIVQLTDPDISSAFLNHLEMNIRSCLFDTGASAQAVSLSIESIRGLAARSYCRAGWLDHAVNLVKLCHQDGMQVKHMTCSFILNFLRGDERADPEHLANIQVLQNLMDKWYPNTSLIGTPHIDRAMENHGHLLDGLGAKGSEVQDLSPQDTAIGPIIPPTSSSSSSVKASALMEYGVSCASQGKADNVYRRIIPAIVKENPPASVLIDFLLKFRNRTLQSTMTRYPTIQIRHISKDMLSHSVRCCVMEGRIDEAVVLLREGGNNQPNAITISAYKVLEDALRNKAAMNEERSSCITYVERMRLLSVPPRGRSITKVQRPASFVSIHRTLKRTPRPSLPMHTDTLIEEITGYEGPVKPKLIQALQKFSISSSYRNTALWAFSNMLYHYRHRAYHAVIGTYADYFLLVGVNRRDVLNVHTEWKRDKRRHPVRLLEGRIIPSPEHVALLWHAMVRRASGHPKTLSGLYNRFLHNVRISKGLAIQNVQSKTSQEPILQLRPPPSQFDDASFTPFILAFCRYRSAEEAVKILSDMVKLGIRPRIHQLTAIASGFAIRGQKEKAMMVLSRIEESPNLAMYTALIRAFVHSGCLDEAVEVERQMLEKLGEVEGLNPKTDRTRAKLKHALAAAVAVELQDSSDPQLNYTT